MVGKVFCDAQRLPGLRRRRGRENRGVQRRGRRKRRYSNHMKNLIRVLFRVSRYMYQQAFCGIHVSTQDYK